MHKKKWHIVDVLMEHWTIRNGQQTAEDFVSLTEKWELDCSNMHKQTLAIQHKGSAALGKKVPLGFVSAPPRCQTTGEKQQRAVPSCWTTQLILLFILMPWWGLKQGESAAEIEPKRNGNNSSPLKSKQLLGDHVWCTVKSEELLKGGNVCIWVKATFNSCFLFFWLRPVWERYEDLGCNAGVVIHTVASQQQARWARKGRKSWGRMFARRSRGVAVFSLLTPHKVSSCCPKSSVGHHVRLIRNYPSMSMWVDACWEMSPCDPVKLINNKLPINVPSPQYCYYYYYCIGSAVCKGSSLWPQV